MEKKDVVQVLAKTLDYVSPQKRPWWQVWRTNPNQEKAHYVVDTAEKVVEIITTTATILSALWQAGNKAKQWVSEQMTVQTVQNPQPQLMIENNPASHSKALPPKTDLNISYTSVFYPEVKSADQNLDKSDLHLSEFVVIEPEADAKASTTLRLT